MPAPVAQLVKLGFNFRKADLIRRLNVTGSRPTQTELIKVGKFTRHQANVLLNSTATPDGGVTPYVGPPFVDLVRIAKFTRHQANAIRQA